MCGVSQLWMAARDATAVGAMERGSKHKKINTEPEFGAVLMQRATGDSERPRQQTAIASKNKTLIEPNSSKVGSGHTNRLEGSSSVDDQWKRARPGKTVHPK